MRAHISLGVLALAFEVVMDTLQVPGRPVDTIAVDRIGSDVAVSRSWTRDNGSGFDGRSAVRVAISCRCISPRPSLKEPLFTCRACGKRGNLWVAVNAVRLRRMLRLTWSSTLRVPVDRDLLSLQLWPNATLPEVRHLAQQVIDLKPYSRGALIRRADVRLAV